MKLSLCKTKQEIKDYLLRRFDENNQIGVFVELSEYNRSDQSVAYLILYLTKFYKYAYLNLK